MKNIIIAISLAFVITGCATGKQDKGAGEASGSQTLPDFSLKDISGKTHSLSSYLGESVILISFWATWCEPCKKEMMQLEKIYAERKNRGFTVLSICMDEPETQGDARTFVRQRRFTFPVLLDSESTVTQKLNPRRSAPFSMLVSKKGEVVWRHEGFVSGDEKEVAKVVDAELLK